MGRSANLAPRRGRGIRKFIRKAEHRLKHRRFSPDKKLRRGLKKAEHEGYGRKVNRIKHPSPFKKIRR